MNTLCMHGRSAGMMGPSMQPRMQQGRTAVVMSCNTYRSAEMRDTEGGASKRSVLEQAEKLKAYLSEQGLA